MSAYDEVLTALVAVEWLAENYERRAKNDHENSLFWSCAAEIAREFMDHLERIADEVENAAR